MLGSASSWEVDLTDSHGKCTCGRMWEKWVTCIHAMAVVRTFRVHSIGHFVHPCFLLSSWEQCYAIPLHAPNSSEIHPNNCLPPERKRVRGRPKGTRAKSQREVEDMLQRVRRCKNCGSTGHTSGHCEDGRPRVIDAGGVYLDPQTGYLEI